MGGFKYAKNPLGRQRFAQQTSSLSGLKKAIDCVSRILPAAAVT